MRNWDFGSSEMMNLFGEIWGVERGRYRVRELRGTTAIFWNMTVGAKFFFFFPVAERWSKVKGPTRQIVTASLLLFSFLFWAFICVVVIWIAGFELYSWWFSFFPDSEGLFFRQSYHVVTYTWSFIPSYHLVLLRFCSILWSINYSSKAKANKEIINESKIT